MEEEFILEMEGITKSFPGVLALNNVNLKVRKGSVHALLGENGAGKSTLMKIILGIHPPEAGKIKFDGKDLIISKPKDALDVGISMIHQELSPISKMTIAENIFLGRESQFSKLFWVDDKAMEKKTAELLKELELDLDPKLKMETLSTAFTQMVEIAKAISYNSKLIIMDEPTSAITEKEVEHLFKIIKRLQSQGVSIIYITHKMDEIFKIADEVTIFRDGEYVSSCFTKDVTQDKLIEMMVGRKITQMFPKESAEIGEVKLEVKNATKKGKFKNVSFNVRKGEILGFAGLMGAGRSEIMECLFGIENFDSGEIYIDNKKVNIKKPKDAIQNKIAFLTEDRKVTGLFPPMSVADNISIANIDAYKKFFIINGASVKKDCEEQRKSLNIKTPHLKQVVNNLSGGNQQKVLIARWLLTYPDILILDEPTRGIDVGAKAEIHSLMCKLVQQGKSVIMISSELPEILGMSDRIVVMHEGVIRGELKREEATQNKIMELATGTN